MANTALYPKLFEAGSIGTMKLRNRIVMPSIAYVYPKPDGMIPERMHNYLEARAKGGAGLIIVEYTSVEFARGFAGIGLFIDDDKYIPAFARTVKAVHKWGAKIGIQLAHVGDLMKPNREDISKQKKLDGPPKLFPSEGPEEFSITRIKEIVDSFGDAALRAKKAGFDGIEIHAAHGSNLLARFLSPTSNKRGDAYGGSIENRLRILLEVVRTVRKSAGPEYPVWCRINGGGTDGVAAGITSNEAQIHARLLEEAGVDALSVSGQPDVQGYYAPKGYFLPYAENVKKAVKIPIIATGNIDPEYGEKIISDGKTDFVIMGRCLIADPELPVKIQRGNQEEIVPCIRCSMCRFGPQYLGPMHCSVNAAFGEEKEKELKPAVVTKNILVIGGGPAGMEAARVAALRGHHVTLYERNKLGGQMILAAIAPHKERIADFTNYLVHQLHKFKVDIITGATITPEIVSKMKPDAVIMATGILPYLPEIPGINNKNVITAQDILSGKTEAGQTVMIIGGELVACETALILADKGKKVTMLRRGPEFATMVIEIHRRPLLDELKTKGVVMIPDIRYDEVTDEALVITDPTGQKQILKAETILLAAGGVPDDSLFIPLQKLVGKVYKIGDCVKPRSIIYAVHEGFNTSFRI
jgi:2,4-dienoyl-CoA reductase-like NADH-dependent reductase (Old Yellow Enzyme family)/thioredoxin reductase